MVAARVELRTDSTASLGRAHDEQDISNRAQAKQREEDAAAAATHAKDGKAGKSHPFKSSSSLPPLPPAPAPTTCPATPSSTLPISEDASPPIPDLQSLLLAAIASREDDGAFQLLVAHLEDRLTTSGARELLVRFGRHKSLTAWYVGEKKGDENEASEGEGGPLVDDVDLVSIEEVLRKAMKHLNGEVHCFPSIAETVSRVLFP